MKSLVLSLSLIALSAHASDDAHIRNLENRVSALEQRKGSGGVILPSAGANLENDVGICFDAELLIWKAHQTGMNFAQNTVTGDTTSTNPYLKPNFRFDPGVRVQVGLRPTHDDWEIDAVWTHFYTKAKRNYENTQTELKPLFETSLGFLSSGSIYAVWRANLNLIDLELSRASYMSKWMSVKPYISIRNAWLHQKYNVTSVPSSVVYESQMRSNLWCIGPRAGFELKFGMGEGVYFFNNTSGSLLWGFFKNSQATVDGSTTIPRNIDIHTSTYNVDMSLGLGWDKRFDDNQYRISIRGAWEHHIFFDTNFFQSNGFVDTYEAFDTPNGNFTTEGFTLAFRFDF
jgi:Legionella pneumophila major outer membrane protein precursor